MADEDRVYLCNHCHFNKVPYQRWKAGYHTCMPCGEKQAQEARHTIVPMAKSNYVVVTDLSLLKGLNKYANT